MYDLTSPNEFSASKCDVGNWIFSKSSDFFEKLLGNFLDFFGGIFWEEFFGRNFLEGIFWKEFLGEIFVRIFLG